MGYSKYSLDFINYYQLKEGISMQGMTKRIFLDAQECLTRGWYARNLPDDGLLDEADEFRMEQGNEVHRLAQQLFPDGTLVQGTSLKDAVEKTGRLMADPTVSTVFEAAFNVGVYATKADIIVRDGIGWKVFEVKSNLHDPVIPDELLDDLTYTVMVMQRSGVQITACSLLRLSREYRKGMGIDRMFGESDLTAAVQQRVLDFSPRWSEILEATSQSEPPTPSFSNACKDCDYFCDNCLGRGIDYSVLQLPRIQPKQIEAAMQLGILDLLKLPDKFRLTDSQRPIVQCVKTGQPFFAPGLKALLGSIQWPAYYLDFETVTTSLPLYSDIAPYGQVVTQYSIHRCSAPGQMDQHFEYLGDPLRDCQGELADRLIQDLGEKGSIIVYHTFEQSRINDLAKRFPNLAVSLSLISSRLFDLCKVIRRGCYHPEFYGSYSIKNVLPAIVPDMSYDGLEIADGGAAIVKYAKMALGRYTAAECQTIRQNLLQYCGQDTLAMVRLHKVLIDNG